MSPLVDEILVRHIDSLTAGPLDQRAPARLLILSQSLLADEDDPSHVIAVKKHCSLKP
jgi:hypothetical protein